MSTAAISLVALVVGWLCTLSLVRDLKCLELTDFSIAAGGALATALLLPHIGFEIWGEYGLRMATVALMGAAAVLTLMVANLTRGRGIRAGARSATVYPTHHAALTVGHDAVKGARISIEHQG
jgi:hypothetical protein